MQDWYPLKPDENILNNLMQLLGIQRCQIEELYNLDFLDEVDKIYGLFFLYNWFPVEETQTQQTQKVVLEQYDSELFFANQIIDNICYLQAILSIVFNSEIEIDQELSQLKDQIMCLDQCNRGLALTNNQNLRAFQNQLVEQNQQNQDVEQYSDIVNFICYLKFNNKIYEIDPMQKGPILLPYQKN